MTIIRTIESMMDRVGEMRTRPQEDVFEELHDNLEMMGREDHLEALELIEAELALPAKVRRRPGEVLKWVDDSAIEDVLWELLNDFPDVTPHPFLAEVVLTLGRRAHLPVIEAFAVKNGSKPIIRPAMMQMLGALEDRRAIPYLEWFTEADSNYFQAEPHAAQRYAYAALAQCGGASSVGFLVRLLSTMADVTDRANVRDALLDMEGEMVAPLIAEMGKGDYGVRGHGIELLVAQHDPRGIPALVRELHSGDFDVDVLVSSLCTFDEPGLRAVLSLELDFEQWDEVAKLLARGLRHQKKQFFSFVCEAGREGERAVQVLSLMEDPETQLALVRLLADHDTETGIRRTIAEYLYLLPGDQGATALCRLLQDPDFDQDSIVVGLRRCSSKKAVSELQKLVQSEDFEIARRASQVLEEWRTN